MPQPKSFSRPALQALVAHDWPGNVRELRYAVERACLLAEGDSVDVDDLPAEILEQVGRRPPPPPPEIDLDEVTAPASADAGEHGLDPDRIRDALERARWRRGEAARLLGISPRTLYRWMKKLRL